MKIEMIDDYAYVGDKKLDNSFVYVSNGDWYLKGSLCWLGANCGPIGALMIGQHKVLSSSEAIARGCSIGHIVSLDGEMCRWEEFDIYDDKKKLLVKAELTS